MADIIDFNNKKGGDSCWERSVEMFKAAGYGEVILIGVQGNDLRQIHIAGTVSGGARTKRVFDIAAKALEDEHLLSEFNLLEAYDRDSRV